MDYPHGVIYLSSHDRELVANALVAHIKHIASLRDQCVEAGLSGYDFNFQIQNYVTILKRLGDE